MKKYIVSLSVILLFAAYVFYRQTQANSPLPLATTHSNAAPITTTSTPVSGTVSGSFKDGSYTSPATDAIYGTIQLQITISGGRLTGINFLQYPNTPGHTTEVSNQTLPVLRSQAIANQSAQVDILSGATQTSEGFSQALAAALAKAK